MDGEMYNQGMHGKDEKNVMEYDGNEHSERSTLA
jgi:hypothetical protein